MRNVALISIPSLVLWVFGIPMLAGYLLHRNRNTLDQANTKNKYGFLYRGYSKRFYYWQLIVIFRKVALVFSSVFFADSIQVQALMAIVLTTMALVSYVYASPMSFSSMDSFEIISLGTIWSIFFLAPFLFADVSNGSKQFVSILIVVLNAGFVATAAKIFAHALKRADTEKFVTGQVPAAVPMMAVQQQAAPMAAVAGQPQTVAKSSAPSLHKKASAE